EGELVWLRKTIELSARVALVVFTVAFVGNVLGYVTFSTLIGNALLGSAYTAVLIYGVRRIALGLVLFAMLVRPLNLLSMVRENRALFRKRIAALLQVSGYVIWFVLTLDLLTLRFQTLRLLSNLLGSRLVVGSLSVSFGNVLAFGLVVWASFLISR